MAPRRRHKTPLVPTLVALAWMGASVACARTPGPGGAIQVDEVYFVSRAQDVAADVGTEAVRGTLAVAQGVRLVTDAPARPGRWRVDGVAQTDPLDAGVLQLGLRATRRDGAEPPLQAYVPLSDPRGPSVIDAAQRAWTLITAMRAVRAAGPARWREVLTEADPARASAQRGAHVGAAPVRALCAPGPTAVVCTTASGRAQLRAVALERLVHRRAQGATAALLDVVRYALDDGADAYERELGLRAVGGLVALRAQNAVLPLIDLAQRREPALVQQLVYAIGALGGRHAEGYLVTVAGGHPDHAVRQAARRAVADLVARVAEEHRFSTPSPRGPEPA